MKREEGKQEARAQNRTEPTTAGGRKTEGKKVETRKAGTTGTEQDRTVTPPGGRDNEGNKYEIMKKTEGNIGRSPLRGNQEGKKVENRKEGNRTEQNVQENFS